MKDMVEDIDKSHITVLISHTYVVIDEVIQRMSEILKTYASSSSEFMCTEFLNSNVQILHDIKVISSPSVHKKAPTYHNTGCDTTPERAKCSLQKRSY